METEEIKNQRKVKELSLFEESNKAPVIIPRKTDGTKKDDGTYVLFGLWPQSIKRTDVKIEERETYKINQWDCYKGSDGYYYVKKTASPCETNDEFIFSNGETIEKGKEYYFKIESIKWRILDDDYHGGKLLLAENGLIASCFDNHYDVDSWEEIKRNINGKTINANNYEYSTIRAYLNGLDGSGYDVQDFTSNGFINKAFSKKAIELINTVIVDNSKISTTDSNNYLDIVDDFVCNNTNDKIFLLSLKEVTNPSYGFNPCKKDRREDTKANNLSRRIEYTDYCLVTGVYIFSKPYGNTCSWWLRSPLSEVVVSARSVYFDGSVDYSSDCVCNFDVAVVPALSISF